MKVTLKAGAWVEPSGMIKAIHDAGFTPVPEDIHLTLVGTLEARDGGVVLVLTGMTTPREMTCTPAPGHDAIPRELKEQSGRKVEIKGRWRFDGAGALEVESVSPDPAEH
jgi:hypothetical protein